MVMTWLTLRELDARAGAPKGTAFRAFKRLASAWREGTDYRVLQPGGDDAEIEALRAAGRTYRSSRSVILLAPAAARTLLDSLRGGE